VSFVRGLRFAGSVQPPCRRNPSSALMTSERMKRRWRPSLRDGRKPRLHSPRWWTAASAASCELFGCHQFVTDIREEVELSAVIDRHAPMSDGSARVVVDLDGLAAYSTAGLPRFSTVTGHLAAIAASSANTVPKSASSIAWRTSARSAV
jgi:hypothetical protein